MGLYALLFVSSPVLVSEAMAWIRRLADAPKSNPSQKVEEWEPQRTKEASTLGLKTMQKWWSNGVECVSANKYFVGPTVISSPDKT